MKVAGFKCGTVYRKKEKCQNKTFINEKVLNHIVIEEVKKNLSIIEIDKTINIIINYYKENNEESKKVKKYKNEIEKLERKKSVLYKDKCENRITIEEFKTEYGRVKGEIKKLQMKTKEIDEKSIDILDKKRIKEIITEFKIGKEFTNDFLKAIIKKIEVYSNLKIEIFFRI